MPSKLAAQDWAVQLPAEVWARVLLYQQGSVAELLANYRHRDSAGRIMMSEPSSLFSSQAEHLRLRLVCKRFNNIFKDHGELSQGLILYPDFPTRMLANLVVWMRFHSSSVKTLAVYCSKPCLEVVLACFVGTLVNLRHTLLEDFSTSAVELLSQLPSVTTCELVRPCGVLSDLSLLL